jgi:hypothetical protein
MQIHSWEANHNADPSQYKVRSYFRLYLLHIHLYFHFKVVRHDAITSSCVQFWIMSFLQKIHECTLCARTHKN